MRTGRRAESAFTSRESRCLQAFAAALLPEGHGLPGAARVGAAGALQERARRWSPRVRSGVRLLLRTWDLSPLVSTRRRFTALTPAEQREWLVAAYRSKLPMRRMQVAALKQVVILVWASQPQIEDAVGYDYRCRRDDEPHGAARDVPRTSSTVGAGSEPDDYVRPGPAVASGAIPAPLLAIRDFRTPNPAPLVTSSWPDLEDGHREVTDVVVVGSGAGGATVASYLAEAGAGVVVLEEGAQVTAADFEGPMFDRLQRFCRDDGTTQVWGMPPIPMPLGRVVGGTTVVNSGTCFRAPAKVLARWTNEFGVADASPDDLAEHYAPIEEFLNVRPVPWDLLGPNGMAAHRGATALGYSGGPLLRNIADCHGCGQCAFGCPTDAKQAMHLTFLPRAQRAGARVYSRCRVERIVIEGERARGVEVTLLDHNDRPRGSMRIDARHVVVSAGAVHSPALLKHSGVPDPSGQTGRNLRIHPATGVGGFFDADIHHWKGTLQSYYIDQFFDSHELMFEATTTIPSIGAGSLPGVGGRAMETLVDLPRLATLGFYVSDTSSGRVRRLPNGQVIPTYRLNDVDARRMLLGLAIAADVLLAAGAKKVYLGLPGLDTIGAREDIDQLRDRSVRPEHLRLTAFHPMGTARMGADGGRSVVDPWGRHHQSRGLWVADASIFPTCVGVNPQMTIMAFAKRTADALVKEV